MADGELTRVWTAAESLAYCAQLTRAHSSTFYLGSRLFPPTERQAVSVVYAVCRSGDDAVDEAPSRDAAHQRLLVWQEHVERAYADAKAAGRWRDEYALTSVDEYWSEGTQFWFNSNKLAAFDGVAVLSEADLARYDPPLAAALREAYGDRHRIAADRFHEHPARVPPGPLPRFTAELC